LAREHGFYETLCDKIRKAAIGSCGVSVVLYSETEVPLFRVPGTFEYILAGPINLMTAKERLAK
jgi:hypothetical protein